MAIRQGRPPSPYTPAVELTPLRYFIAIARAGHMTRAAETLGVTQPALSAALKKLEEQVGAPLLHRTGRGVALTEAGAVFLEHAQDAVGRADAGARAVRELLGLQRGSIRIGGGATATSYLLPRVVSAVRRAHPGLRFFVREAGSNAVAAAVLAGELDLGIVTLPITQGGGGGGGGAGELVERALVDDELRLITPAGHRLAEEHRTQSAERRAREAGGAAPPGFRWRDLEGESVVGFEAGTAVRAVVDRAAGHAHVALNYVMELRSIESIKRMVAAGIGVGFVSRFALRDEGEDGGGGLVCREGRLSRRLAIVRRADRVPSPAAARFEEELIAQARQM
jgi:DNA-binding transcriptional LysR family regulator